MNQLNLANVGNRGKLVRMIGWLFAVTLLAVFRCDGAALYYTREFLEDPSCVYNTNEAFVLIGKTKTAEMVGASAVLWGLAGQRNESLQRVAEDLIVCHVTNGQARIYYLNQSSFGSGAFFFKETMYYGWGSSVPGEPVLWRWSGTNFTRLAKSKADAIRSQFRYTSDLMAEEGWQEIPCVSFRSYAGTGDKAPLEVSGRRLWLVVKQEGGFSGKSTVLIRGLAGSNSEQPIITLDQSMKRIDQATYNRLRLIATKTRIPGAR